MGPTAYVPTDDPCQWPAAQPGYAVSSSARPNPLNFPTIDAWNLSVQRAITPTLSLTVAYVGNKGTHTLGDGDNNGTNPNEAAIILPGADSITGQTLHYDPSVPAGTIVGQRRHSTGNLLQRYYGGYAAGLHGSQLHLRRIPSPGVQPAPACAAGRSIAYRGDDQNTEFDALQVTSGQPMSQGLAWTRQLRVGQRVRRATGYYTWSHAVVHQRDSNVRDQQLTVYGSYDFPFGKGKQYMASANHATDLIIGGFQISDVTELVRRLALHSRLQRVRFQR